MITIALTPKQAQLLFAVLGTAQPTHALGDQPAGVRNALVLAHAATIQQIEAGLEAHQEAQKEQAEAPAPEEG